MNRNAIAMAADSAVTVGDHAAIHNSANKLFSLSRVAPVGVIIYADATLMDIPVEIIIKEYKKQLSDKTFDFLAEYVNDFIKYLEDNKELFRFDLNEKAYVLQVFFDLMKGLENGYHKFLEAKKNETSRNLNAKEIIEVANEAVQETLTYVDDQKRIPEFSFSKYIKNKYRTEFMDFLKKTDNFKWMSDNQRNAIADKTCALFDTEFERNGYLGIAIAGFGDKEIFPHMVHLHISGMINGKLRYQKVSEEEISEKNKAAIIPLAQTDVMQTFLLGINNQFIRELAKDIPEEIQKCISILDDSLFAPGKKDEVLKNLQALAPVILQRMNDIAGKNYVGPIIQSVATLPIEELALLAESMINITSVRRKVALDHNIGTVGGPIDVAIISKGDGLIWLKRKHYFDGKYNPQYFYSHFDRIKKDEPDDKKSL